MAPEQVHQNVRRSHLRFSNEVVYFLRDGETGLPEHFECIISDRIVPVVAYALAFASEHVFGEGSVEVLFANYAYAVVWRNNR